MAEAEATAKAAEDDRSAAWIAYGAALNVGRAEFPKGDNTRFSEWCDGIANDKLSLVNEQDRASAMWAAANPIIAIFVRRWQVEVTFSEVRADLGVETQRQWSQNAITAEAASRPRCIA